MGDAGEFGWLHLTDLHAGGREDFLWPRLEDEFMSDLEKLRKLSGPWDVVFFTGDLVYSGERGEYAKFEKIRQRILGEVERLCDGNKPIFFAVPGNHDVKRWKRQVAALSKVDQWHRNPRVVEEFWKYDNDDLRKAIEKALKGWTEWSKTVVQDERVQRKEGTLPGDFSATFEVAGLSVGVAGLNSTFLQLAGGNRKGRLALDVRQLAPVYEHSARWAGEHHVTFLLTHQPPDWLTKDAFRHFREQVAPPGKLFDVHLYGHEHTGRIRFGAEAGRTPQLDVLGRSLFGLEFFGEGKTMRREHGYSAGRVRVNGRSRTFARLWPRAYVEKADDSWALQADPLAVLTTREATDELEIKREKRPPFRPPQSAGAKAGVKRRGPRSAAGTRAVEETYRQWLLRQYDSIKLVRSIGASTGSDPSIDSLYVPLRLDRWDDRGELSVTPDPRGDLRLRSDDPSAARETEVEGLKRAVEVSGLGAEAEAREDIKRAVADSALGAEADARESAARLGRSSRHLTFGELLRADRRFVVVGKAGTGKSTLLRWAVAGLIRRQAPDQPEAFPDSAALPQADLLPVIYRCGRLAEAPSTLEDLLATTIDAMPLPRSARNAFVEHLLARFDAGSAALLIDGLDELRAGRRPGDRDPVADRDMRLEFCAKVDEFSVAYNRTPVVVTTRLAPFDDIEDRLSWGFAKTGVAEWSRADKESFAQRLGRVMWPTDTDRQLALESTLRQLIADPQHHELTSTPLLLASMSSIANHPGGLPERRVDVYAAAMHELLHRRRDGIDDEEAVPQLHYLAYWMLDRTAAQCTRQDLEMALRTMRKELRTCDEREIRPMHAVRDAVERHSARQFVDLLVNDTDVLTVTGERVEHGVTHDLLGFHHPIFKEFLAGRAIANEHFPGACKVHSPTEQIVRLSAPITKPDRQDHAVARIGNALVSALRFAVAFMEDQTDDALEALTKVEPGSDGESERPKAVLAALVLAAADPKYVEEPTAGLILDRLVSQVDSELDGQGRAPPTSLDAAALELASTPWSKALAERLVAEMRDSDPDMEASLGGLCGMIAGPPDDASLPTWIARRKDELGSADDSEVVTAALGVMYAAYRGYPVFGDELWQTLIDLLQRETVVAGAAAWALWWLTEAGYVWNVADSQKQAMVSLCEDDQTSPVVRARILVTLANLGEARALEIARSRLEVEDAPDARTWLLLRASIRVVGEFRRRDALDAQYAFDLVRRGLDHPSLRKSTVTTLGDVGDPRAIALLTPLLAQDPDQVVRVNAAYALGTLLAGVEPGERRSEVATATSLLTARLEDDTPRVRRACAWALGAAGVTSAVSALTASLRRKQLPEIRHEAAFALGQLGGSAAITALSGALDDLDVRVKAAEALAYMRDARAAEMLLDRVAGGETDLVDETARAIWDVPVRRRAAVLGEMAGDANPEGVRRTAARLVGDWCRNFPTDDAEPTDGVVRRRLSEILGQLLADREATVRRTVLETLPSAGGWLTFERLESVASGDPVAQVRALALYHLRVQPDERSVAVLRVALGEDDAEVVRQALAGLAEYGAAVPRDSLRQLVARSEPEIRTAAVRILGSSPQDDDFELVVDASADPDRAVRHEALDGLGRWAVSRAVWWLQAKLLDSAQTAREQVVTALRKDDDGPAVAAFLERLLDDDRGVRAAAVGAIGRLGARRLENAAKLLERPSDELWQRVVDAFRARRDGDPDASLRTLATSYLQRVEEGPRSSGPGERPAFIVLLDDEDDASGLARLLDDVQAASAPPSAFAAPPVRGIEFFTNDDEQSRLDRWWRDAVPDGAMPVYLLMHEEGLPQAMRGVDGRFYVGIVREELRREYADLAGVSPFVAGGPLDFAVVVMRDFSDESLGDAQLYDPAEGLRMAMLAEDFPIGTQ